MATRPDNLIFSGELPNGNWTKNLKLPSFLSNLTVHICLEWPSMTSTILVRKLQFLAKLLQPGSHSISSYIFTAAAITDPWNVSIIQQCRMLENITGTNTLHSCLENPETTISIIKAEKKTSIKGTICQFN